MRRTGRFITAVIGVLAVVIVIAAVAWYHPELWRRDGLTRTEIENMQAVTESLVAEADTAEVVPDKTE